MLDLFNIQVENPVAVLDQEESKKFLMGKPEDKYAFFCKATELERIDRQYISTLDHVEDLEIQRGAMMKSLRPQAEVVEKLKGEWDECQKLDKIESKITKCRIHAAWALVNDQESTDAAVMHKRDRIQEEHTKLEEKLRKHEENPPSEEAAQADDEKLKQLTDEANKAKGERARE